MKYFNRSGFSKPFNKFHMDDPEINQFTHLGNSMSPSINPGDVVFVLPFQEYLSPDSITDSTRGKNALETGFEFRQTNPSEEESAPLHNKRIKKVRIGDVVLFRDSNSTNRIAHRIMGYHSQGFVTQGDNSHTPDLAPLHLNQILGWIAARQRRGRWTKVHGGWRGRVIGAYYRGRNRVWRALGRRLGGLYRGSGNILAGMLKRGAPLPMFASASTRTCLQDAGATDECESFEAQPRPSCGAKPMTGQASSIKENAGRAEPWPRMWPKRWLSERLRFRLVEYTRPCGVETHLFLGDKAIGKRVTGAGEWRIRFPYRLLVNPERLPGQMETQNINREGAKDAKRTATRKISRIT